MGVIYSATAAILVGYWDVITGLPGITFEWIAPISFVVSVVTSCLFSLLPTRQKNRGGDRRIFRRRHGAAGRNRGLRAALLPLSSFR